MTEQHSSDERQATPVMGRIWEFTKDISMKVSRKAEKHWKINSLRVEIASIRHNINNKYRELGRYVYESLNAQAIEEESYKATLTELFDELKHLESEILVRENRIELLEQEVREQAEVEASDAAALAEGARPDETVIDATVEVTEEVSETEVTAEPVPEEHVDLDEGAGETQMPPKTVVAEAEPLPKDATVDETVESGDDSVKVDAEAKEKRKGSDK